MESYTLQLLALIFWPKKDILETSEGSKLNVLLHCSISIIKSMRFLLRRREGGKRNNLSMASKRRKINQVSSWGAVKPTLNSNGSNSICFHAVKLNFVNTDIVKIFCD